MNYPVERERMSPVPTRPGPEAYAQPQHRPQPSGMTDQERLHLGQLLSRAENILALQEERDRQHALDQLANILYDLPYRHTMEMSRGLTKVEGGDKIGTPESLAAIMFAWAEDQRSRDRREEGA